MAGDRPLLLHLHLLVDCLLTIYWFPLSQRLNIVLLKPGNLLGHIEWDDILVDGTAVQAEGGEVQGCGESPGPALGGGGGAVVGQADHVGRESGAGSLYQGGKGE